MDGGSFLTIFGRSDEAGGDETKTDAITLRQSRAAWSLIAVLDAIDRGDIAWDWDYRTLEACGIGVARALGIAKSDGDFLFRSPLGLSSWSAYRIFVHAPAQLDKLSGDVTAGDVARLLEAWLTQKVVCRTTLQRYFCRGGSFPYFCRGGSFPRAMKWSSIALRMTSLASRRSMTATSWIARFMATVGRKHIVGAFGSFGGFLAIRKHLKRKIRRPVCSYSV